MNLPSRAANVTVRIINADPLTTAITVIIDGEPAAGPLVPKQSEALQVSATSHTLTLINPQTSETLTENQSLNLTGEHCYTVVLARETTGAESKLKPVIVPSECRAPEGSKANATFVLASPSVEQVDVYAGWFKIISNLKRGQFEGPKTVPAGEYKVVAKEGSKAVLGPIELAPKPGHSYTIVAFDDAKSGNGERLTHHVYEDNFTSGTK
jgi:hypothetical protein